VALSRQSASASRASPAARATAPRPKTPGGPETRGRRRRSKHRAAAIRAGQVPTTSSAAADRIWAFAPSATDLLWAGIFAGVRFPVAPTERGRDRSFRDRAFLIPAPASFATLLFPRSSLQSR
jgi:hypothetical protein